MYLYSHHHGLSIVDRTTLDLSFVAGTREPEFEYGDLLVEGARQSLVLLMHGGGFVAARVIDSAGAVHTVKDVTYAHPGGILEFSGVSVSVNDGESRFVAQPVYTDLAPAYGLVLLSDTNSATLLLAHPSSPNAPIATPIPNLKSGLNVARRLYHAGFATDSVMWFLRTKGRADTICRARIGELTYTYDRGGRQIGGSVVLAIGP